MRGSGNKTSHYRTARFFSSSGFQAAACSKPQRSEFEHHDDIPLLQGGIQGSGIGSHPNVLLFERVAGTMAVRMIEQFSVKEKDRRRW
jgi:hypothetical protein